MASAVMKLATQAMSNPAVMGAIRAGAQYAQEHPEKVKAAMRKAIRRGGKHHYSGMDTDHYTKRGY